MTKMRIVAVCGFGVGSSVILKITLNTVLRELGVTAEVATADLTTATSEPADLYITSKELGARLAPQTNKPVIMVANVLSKDEVRAAIEPRIG